METSHLQVREEFKAKAPMMAGLMGSAAASATGLLAKDAQPSDVDAWVEYLPGPLFNGKFPCYLNLSFRIL